MRAVVAHVCAFWLLLPIAGCRGAEPDAVPRVSERDSAGVRIVENANQEGSGAERRMLAVAPRLSIGAFEGEEVYQLHVVTGAARLSDGRIIVANAGTHELRLFAADGVHVLSMGREGEGPGEFRSLNDVGTFGGDSVYAFDQALQRITIFTDRGEFVRTLRVPPHDEVVRAARLLADGTVISESLGGAPARTTADATARQTARYFLSPGESGSAVAFAQFPAAEWYRMSIGGDAGWRTVPFTPEPSWAVRGERVYIVGGAAHEFLVLDGNGTPERIVRRVADPPRLAAEMITRWREASLTGVPQALRPQIERVLDQTPLPGTAPTYEDVRVDPPGAVWLKRYSGPGETGNVWEVFASEGRFVGTMEMPAGFEVFEIGRDYVLGKARDELGVEYVQMLPLKLGNR